MSNILNIQMTVPGVQLAIAALRKLPHDQVDELVRELTAQANAEIARLQAANKVEAPGKGKKAKVEQVEESTGLTD